MEKFKKWLVAQVEVAKFAWTVIVVLATVFGYTATLEKTNNSFFSNVKQNEQFLPKVAKNAIQEVTKPNVITNDELTGHKQP